MSAIFGKIAFTRQLRRNPPCCSSLRDHLGMVVGDGVLHVEALEEERRTGLNAVGELDKVGIEDNQLLKQE